VAADPQLVRAWLEARSVARDLPPPVPEYGGFRVDTRSEAEIRRWVFPDVVEGIGRLAQTFREPRHLIKLCGTAEELTAALPRPWLVEGGRWFMEVDCDPEGRHGLPAGYHLKLNRDGAVSNVEIRAGRGELAASGFAAETSDAFVYDRIETDPQHRRRGLARAVMAALGSCRQSAAARQLLMATTAGERLYSSLGWHKLSTYSTACLPET